MTALCFFKGGTSALEGGWRPPKAVEGGSEALEARALSVGEKYDWIEEVLIRFSYRRLKRAEKGVIRRYIERITGYSRSQVSRLITPIPQEVYPGRCYVIGEDR